MFCGNCGAQNPDDSVFCETCGASLQDEVGGGTDAGNSGYDPGTENFEPGGIMAQPKKKPPVALLGILGGAAAAVIVIVLFATGVIGGGLKGEKKNTDVKQIAYLKGNKLYYVRDMTKGEPEGLAVTKIKGIDPDDEYDSYYSDYAFFGESGKYLYFFTKYDTDEGEGTFARIPVSKISDDPDQNADHTEIIKKGINKSGMSVLKNDLVLLMNEDGELTCYDGKDEYDLADEVETVTVSDDNKTVLYLGDRKKKTDTLSLFTVPTNGSADPIELDDGISNGWTTSTDFLVYGRTDDEEEGTYSVSVYDGKNITDVSDNVSRVYADEDKKCFYYLINDPIKVKAKDYVDDPYDAKKDAKVEYPSSSDYEKESDYDKAYEEYEKASTRNAIREDLKKLKINLNNYQVYYWSRGKSELVAENVSGITGYINGVLFFHERNGNVEDVSISIDDLSYADQVEDLLEDQGDGSYQYVVGNGNIGDIMPGGRITDFYDTDNGKGIVLELKPESGNSDKDEDDEDEDEDDEDEYKGYLLCKYSVSGSSLKDNGIIDEQVYVAAVTDDAVYYYVNVEDGEGDLYQWKKGNYTRIAKNVNSDGTRRVGDDGYYCLTTDTDDDGYELTLFDSNGEKLDKVDDGIENSVYFRHNRICYIKDDALYLYDGGGSEKISKNVVSWWFNGDAGATYLSSP